MTTLAIQQALDALRVAAATTRSCERGSAERAAADVDEERARKAVWNAVARTEVDEHPAAPS